MSMDLPRSRIRAGLRVSGIVALLGTIGAGIVSYVTIRPELEGGPIKSTPLNVTPLFAPSGWMGDAAKGNTFVKADFQSTEKPRPGGEYGKVNKFTYLPGPEGWAGVAWQYPANNWGEHLGLRIRRAQGLIFWAAGESGNEIVEFSVGVMPNTSLPFHDSLRKTLTTTLSASWTQYRIDLNGEDLQDVITAFAWTVSTKQNPHGVTLFVDGIRLE
jgi:hypothetical protein